MGVASHRLGPGVAIRIIPLRSCLCLLCVLLLNVLIPPVASLRPRTLGSSNSCCYRCTRKLSFGRHCGFLFSPPISFLLLLHGNQAQGLLLVPLQSLLPHNNWEGAHRGIGCLVTHRKGIISSRGDGAVKTLLPVVIFPVDNPLRLLKP